MKHRIKKIYHFIISKTFLGALGFAFALWLYITLNTEFITFVKLPLVVKLPANRAIESPLPPFISVKVRGTGWQIFNLNYFNSAAKCEIDLINEKISDSLHLLSRIDIMKNLQSTLNIDAIDVMPSMLNLSMGKIEEFSIIIKPDVVIEPSDGYMLVGDVLTKPDLINIAGNEKIIQKITEWKTIPYKVENAREPIFSVVPLVDSLTNIVTLSQNTVKVIADIQKISEIEVRDIPVQISGSDLPKEHQIMPKRLTITLRGGIDDIVGLNYDNISITVNSADVLNDTTGILIPRVELPQNIKMLTIRPQYITHKVIIQ